eukprot:6200996-Pleurochrysis_carterae.AAC.5
MAKQIGNVVCPSDGYPAAINMLSATARALGVCIIHPDDSAMKHSDFCVTEQMGPDAAQPADVAEQSIGTAASSLLVNKR